MSIFPFKTNFSLIAENTTKYYIELKTRYGRRFPDDASLLAAAGILDAQNYIFPSPPKIEITDVIELARRCTAKDKNHIPIRANILLSQMTLDSWVSYLDSDSIEPPECTDEVFDFVFGLELLLFKAENKRLPPSEIEEACRRKYKTIEKAITGTMKKYSVGKGIFAQATTMFMEDVSLKQIRDRLGILQ
jgi:hypothetical protein